MDWMDGSNLIIVNPLNAEADEEHALREDWVIACFEGWAGVVVAAAVVVSRGFYSISDFPAPPQPQPQPTNSPLLFLLFLINAFWWPVVLAAAVDL